MSKPLSKIFILALSLITVPIRAGKDPQWDNGQFSITRETITSVGYKTFVTGIPMFERSDGSDIFSITAFSYGIGKRIGCTFTLPFLLKLSIGEQKVRGLWDLRFNFQWHLYRTEEHILVLKTGMWFPTAQGETPTPFGVGSGSFNPTVSLTGIHSSERLYAGFVIGSIISTTRKHKKPGSLIDYYLGIGPKFRLQRSNRALYTYLELQGYFTFPDKMNGIIMPNSGNNLILLGPAIVYDTDWWQVQGRVAIPISDRRFGVQQRTDLFASFWYGVRF
jgi:hypothetical protein